MRTVTIILPSASLESMRKLSSPRHWTRVDGSVSNTYWRYRQALQQDRFLSGNLLAPIQRDGR